MWEIHMYEFNIICLRSDHYVLYTIIIATYIFNRERDTARFCRIIPDRGFRGSHTPRAGPHARPSVAASALLLSPDPPERRLGYLNPQKQPQPQRCFVRTFPDSCLGILFLPSSIGAYKGMT